MKQECVVTSLITLVDWVFVFFSILTNYDQHDNGRIWVIWNKASLVVKPLSIGNQWIHVHVESPGCPTIQVSFIYGLNSLEGRVGLWSFMQNCIPNGPWICLGDYNCVRNTDERISSKPANLQAIDEFNNAISSSGLDELVTHGCTFTWTNKQDENDRKWMRLDRVLVNSDWIQRFPASYADALVAGVSDHYPLVITVQTNDVQRPKQFRYLNCWGQDPSFVPVVKKVWESEIQGCPMYRLITHLKLVKGKLKDLHKGRAKITDVKMMDASTQYFFAKVAANRSRSHISKIQNTTGLDCTTFDSISDAFLDYYKGLLGTASQWQVMVGRTPPKMRYKGRYQKAFDSLNRDFLKAILPLLVSPSLCHWIITCVTTTRFSLNINGSSVGYFEGKRGLRQGDPLSPLLFVLSMEVLSRMLRRLNDSSFSYHPKCYRIGLTHLIFADDLLVFARGDFPSVKAVETCLQKFAEFSGLQPNPAKTNIYFGGVHPDVKNLILCDTSYLEGTFPFRYLGVPLHSSRLKRVMYHSLLDKIKSKVTYWANKYLSYAGKVQLINSVIFGIETFWCASFLLPKGVMQEIERLCRQFLWNYQAARKMGADIWTVVPGNATSIIRKALLLTRDDFISLVGSVDIAKNLLSGWSLSGSLLLHRVYSVFKGRHSNLQWAKPLMDQVVLPKHAIITRLVVQNGLPTVDNLIRRRMVIVNRCSLCMADLESIRHLYFVCPYSSSVYQQILLWTGVTRRPLCLRQELLSLSRYKGKGWKKKWARGCVAAVVYLLWQERNRRLFEEASRNVDQLVKLIKYFVSIRLYANVSNYLFDEIVAHLVP
ncbi:uncharacterized protein LOC141617727 [Silene latifolia]|uniref:uncharacterized protein LOC141617727 n=1 Tax=Silene latifolia TaxID=37657 RepID=UPI003D76E7C9